MRYPAAIYFKPGCTTGIISECTKILKERFIVDETYSREVTLTEKVLKALYENLQGVKDRPLWEETLRRLQGKRVKVLTLLVNDKELKELTKCIGTHVNPKRCEPGSFRYRFGGGKEEIPGSDKFWFKNWIHRPRTKQEARSHFSALFEEELYEVT